jgi:hypothetical protein
MWQMELRLPVCNANGIIEFYNRRFDEDWDAGPAGLKASFDTMALRMISGECHLGPIPWWLLR